MRGPVASLAVRDNFFVRRYASPAVHGFQLGVRFEFAAGVQVIGPFDMNRARNGSAPGRSNLPADKFGAAPRVED